MSEKNYKIINIDNIEDDLKKKLDGMSQNKLFISQDILEAHLTENEILDCIKKGYIDDKTLD